MHPAAPDSFQREAARRERARNVLVEAGAGTGKTTLIVDRLIELVAPQNEHTRALSLERIAAVTFTRRAAGELRVRIREQLLAQLRHQNLSQSRERRLRGALDSLDTAAIGTMHAFADQLLRLYPVEAQLSPSYTIVEDNDELAHEAIDTLFSAAQQGTLAAEISATVLDVLGSGIRVETLDTDFGCRNGFDRLLKGFINQRDVPPHELPVSFDASAFRSALDALLQLCRGLPDEPNAPGVRYWRQAEARLLPHRDERDPMVLLREIIEFQRGARFSTKKGDFGGNQAAWEVHCKWQESHEDAIAAPLRRWMAARLLKLSPAIVALYDRAKQRHRAVDPVDLLVRLRDLLATNRQVRGDLQARFDHLLVDEFQDTDPLQAQIIVFLCEAGVTADDWSEAQLTPGKLTIVGDPKQSIYRFRRADIATYQQVWTLLQAQNPLHIALTTNFRSAPSLIDWINHRFAQVLGEKPRGCPLLLPSRGLPLKSHALSLVVERTASTPPPRSSPVIPMASPRSVRNCGTPPNVDRAFDQETGEVYHQRLLAGRSKPTGPAVDVLPLIPSANGKTNTAAWRELEAHALANYLHELVETGDVRLGDIAILTISTTTLQPLLRALDAAEIPHQAHGGSLFLREPLHRRFLLALRAISDATDGVAQAALWRPPFFQLSPADVAAQSAQFHKARQQIESLRALRLLRSPGATVLDVLERTDLACTTTRGPNGKQRIAALRELCLVIEQIAKGRQLHYDDLTLLLRNWVVSPDPIDYPESTTDDALRVMTIHQAKGLEFPVVVLWDCRAPWRAPLDRPAWRIDRDSGGFAISLDGFHCEEPTGLAAVEARYRDAERKRLVYVAATRARDRLVLTQAQIGDKPDPRTIAGTLIDGSPSEALRILEPYRQGGVPQFRTEVDAVRSKGREEPRRRHTGSMVTTSDEASHREYKSADGRNKGHPLGVGATCAKAVPRSAAPIKTVDETAKTRWLERSGVAAQSRLPAHSVTELADKTPTQYTHSASRFGPVFGETVHRAIGLVLSKRAQDAAQAVRTAALATGLAVHLDEAASDVTCAVAALRRESLFGHSDATLQLEVPLAGVVDGKLLSGNADLILIAPGRMELIDFKTDSPPENSVEISCPAYVQQIRTYAQLVTQCTRVGLLFTANGKMCWL